MKTGTDKLEAIVEHDGDEKYVVLEVQGSTGIKSVVVSLPIDNHSGIVRQYESRLKDGEEILEVRGGGILTIDRQEKTIKTYGMSGSYGPPDSKSVKKILEDDFPDYKIVVKVTDYVR